MYSEAKRAPLVDQVYDTLLDADAWPRALSAIADALGGRLPVSAIERELKFPTD
jgi:hypothetical protein